MEIQIREMNQSESSISIESDSCINLEFENKAEEKKAPAQACFKVIYGLGNNADRLRMLAAETKEAKRLREE